MKNVDTQYITIKDSPIHGKGVVAAKAIKSGTLVIEYVGEEIDEAEFLRRIEEYGEYVKDKPHLGQVYMFELNDQITIDGDVDWNPAKYINHSCSPNLEIYRTQKQIFLKAIRDIKRGEELFYNYGFDLDEYEDHPCKCGSANCVGYIVAEKHWPELHKLLEEKQK